jgi:hypothetical protein
MLNGIRKDTEERLELETYRDAMVPGLPLLDIPTYPAVKSRISHHLSDRSNLSSPWNEYGRVFPSMMVAVVFLRQSGRVSRLLESGSLFLRAQL